VLKRDVRYRFVIDIASLRRKALAPFRGKVVIATKFGFSAGWPNAMSAATRAKELLQKEEK